MGDATSESVGGGFVNRSHNLGAQKKVSRSGLLWSAMSGGTSETKGELSPSAPAMITLKRHSIRGQLIR